MKSIAITLLTLVATLSYAQSVQVSVDAYPTQVEQVTTEVTQPVIGAWGTTFGATWTRATNQVDVVAGLYYTLPSFDTLNFTAVTRVSNPVYDGENFVFNFEPTGQLGLQVLHETESVGALFAEAGLEAPFSTLDFDVYARAGVALRY